MNKHQVMQAVKTGALISDIIDYVKEHAGSGVIDNIVPQLDPASLSLEQLRRYGDITTATIFHLNIKTISN